MVSKRLRECRKKAGLSQGQVAEYEGISQGHISDLETGRSVPQVLDVITKLARRYEVSTDYLLGLTDNPTPRASGQTPVITAEQLAVLGVLSSLDEEEQNFVMDLLNFVKKRTTPRIIGE